MIINANELTLKSKHNSLNSPYLAHIVNTIINNCLSGIYATGTSYCGSTIMCLLYFFSDSIEDCRKVLQGEYQD